MKPIRGHSMSWWSRRLGGTDNLVADRLRRGWDKEDAIGIPKGTVPHHPPLLIDEYPDLLRDVLAGEGSAATLAARYECSERSITRIRSRLRRRGIDVRVPSAEAA